MIGTTVYELFRTLDVKERLKFRKFLHSPYFNRRKDVILLYEYLEERSDLASREEAHERLFPGKKFNNRDLNHVGSYLAERIERFLASEEFFSDTFREKLYRCRAFRKRGLWEHFDTNAEELLRLRQALPERDARWQLMEYQLQNEIFARRIVETRANAGNIESVTRLCADFFILEQLRWIMTARAFQTLSSGETVSIPLLEETRAAAAVSQNPAVKLLYAGYLAQTQPDDMEAFYAFKKGLSTSISLFPPAEARDLYMIAINVAIRRHNRGDRQFTEEAFLLYKEAWEREFLPEEGVLPKYTYINMLNLAQLVGRDDWARSFLQSGAALLPEGERENIQSYALAGYHFRRSEYPEVLQLLQSVEFSEVFIQLDARKMLLRAYFELGEWAALDSLLDSFKTYLHRRKNLGYHRDMYLNLVKFTQKLIRAPEKNRAWAKRLADRIRHAEGVAEREWLLEKIKPG